MHHVAGLTDGSYFYRQRFIIIVHVLTDFKASDSILIFDLRCCHIHELETVIFE